MMEQKSKDDNKSMDDSEIMFYSVLSVVIFIGFIVFKPQQTMSAVAGVTETACRRACRLLRSVLKSARF